ncbi:aldolase/citrate lyase family protein [Mycolicibacterium sp. P9-22]|uniref:aldolase/citrate lyase family protein n=1 Tax=Mycolicibacterium sp. P9-22 TaxID=2024613 RepID=UPI001884373C|nr:aldolase/citrate lyase family protein [Mycolicibacterium sp. P9-22]
MTAAESPLALARSWLLARPVDTSTLAAAAAHGPDNLIVDLEDGIPFAGKPAAREFAREWLGAHHGWVRVNNVTTPHFAADIAAVTGLPGLLGIVLSKTESAADVKLCAEALPDVPIIAMIESAYSLLHAAAIADTPPVVRLICRSVCQGAG